MNCRIREKICCSGRTFLEQTEARKRTADCRSAEFFGYQTLAVMFKCCTVLISKHPPLKVCQDFSAFLWYSFLIRNPTQSSLVLKIILALNYLPSE